MAIENLSFIERRCVQRIAEAGNAMIHLKSLEPGLVYTANIILAALSVAESQLCVLRPNIEEHFKEVRERIKKEVRERINNGQAKVES